VHCIAVLHGGGVQGGDTKLRDRATCPAGAGGLMHALFNHLKERTMQRIHATVLGTIAALGLAAAATAAIAHSGGMGEGKHEGKHEERHGAKHEGKHEGMHGGMHGGMGAMGAMGGMQQHGGPGQQLMTPQEREALREKMRSAKSPEERQAVAAANRAEMEKRAKEKGIALPEQRGPGRQGAGHGPGGGSHKQ
jgi:hypothetical protein